MLGLNLQLQGKETWKNIVKLSNGITVTMKAKVKADGLEVVYKKPEYLGPEDMRKHRSGIHTAAYETIQASGDSKK